MRWSPRPSNRRQGRRGRPGRRKIILSCKVSSVRDLIAIYRELSKRSDYALHLGSPEAGMGSKGIVASTAPLSVLLQEGIGDTIRVSLTPEPGRLAFAGSHRRPGNPADHGPARLHPDGGGLPGCGRTTSTFFQELAGEVQDFVRARMPQWKLHYDGAENMTLAVMGCIVNGPGESKHANIGISLPGTGEARRPRSTRMASNRDAEGRQHRQRIQRTSSSATSSAPTRRNCKHESNPPVRARDERYPAG